MPGVEDGVQFWTAAHAAVEFGVRGSTPLDAAMKVFVASKFGMLIDVDGRFGSLVTSQ